MHDDDDATRAVVAAMTEREAVADGRPDVYTYPLDAPAIRAVQRNGRRRLVRRGPHDLLLVALYRAHGDPRYDLVD
jgi:hypothetical protein